MQPMQPKHDLRPEVCRVGLTDGTANEVSTLFDALPRLLHPQKTQVALGAGLDGSTGLNRSQGRNQLDADDDATAVKQFLAEYQRSPSTLRAYTKEAERLLLWAALARHKPLSSLNREDFVAYEAFLADPQPHQIWCGPRRGRLGARMSVGWRPFVGPLGPAARRAALTIINSMLSYLVDAKYLAANPLALVRQRNRPHSTTARNRITERAFDTDEWTALVQELQNEDTSPTRERERYIVALLYFLALRVGELTTHTMGDFRCVRGHWRFFVVGKGDKAAEIPVNQACLAALGRFRQTLNLPLLPEPDETLPLVPAHPAGGALSARRINQIIKALVDRVAEKIATEAPHKAAHMRSASAHWFRHTSLTRQAQSGIDFAHLKANARHSKLETTMLYIHTEEEARHKAMARHTWLQQAPPGTQTPGSEL
jgi:site-specific recombinase XerD